MAKGAELWHLRGFDGLGGSVYASRDEEVKVRLAMLNTWAAAVVLALAALAGPVAAQSGPAESPYLAEFLRRLVAPAQEGRPFDLSGLERGDTVHKATTHFAHEGSFVATFAPKGDGVQVFAAASADENPTPQVRNSGQVFVVMTKAEMDALVAAFLHWQSATKGVAVAARCKDWLAPGSVPHILLQSAAILKHADGRPMVLEVHVGNTVSPALSKSMKPIWLASLVLTIGEEWRC